MSQESGYVINRETNSIHSDINDIESGQSLIPKSKKNKIRMIRKKPIESYLIFICVITIAIISLLAVILTFVVYNNKILREIRDSNELKVYSLTDSSGSLNGTDLFSALDVNNISDVSNNSFTSLEYSNDIDSNESNDNGLTSVEYDINVTTAYNDVLTSVKSDINVTTPYDNKSFNDRFVNDELVQVRYDNIEE